MIALLPLLINLAGQFGPTLAKMIAGDKAGDVVGTILGTAKSVFGTDDPAAIVDAAKNNPELVALYIERVKAETEQYKASLVDVADARAQTIKLVESGSVIAWGAPVVSVIVVVGFVTLLGLWLFHPPASDSASLAVLNIMVGTLATAFGSVTQYWLGSSASSANKDKVLGTALVNSQVNTAKALTNGHR